MLPLLTLASGIVAGVITVRFIKKANAAASLTSFAQKARHGLDRAGEELRDATVYSLSAVEKSSASLRGKLEPSVAEPPAAETAAAVDAAPAAAPAPKRRATASRKRKNEKA